MPLRDLAVPPTGGTLPPDVRRFIREADRRIAQFQIDCLVPAFVPSSYAAAYGVLRWLSDSTLARGRRFCEWGSGFGVVASLASMLDFESCGIEVEGSLVSEANRLAEDFGLSVEFVHGSFIPRGAEDRVHASGSYSWLTTEATYAYDDLGLDAADMDVVFAYPGRMRRADPRIVRAVRRIGAILATITVAGVSTSEESGGGAAGIGALRLASAARLRLCHQFSRNESRVHAGGPRGCAAGSLMADSVSPSASATSSISTASATSSVATSATATTPPPTTTATATAVFLGPRLVDGQRAAVHLLAVHPRDRGLSLLIGPHLDEPEPLGPTGVPVHDHLSRHDSSVGRKHVLQLAIRHPPTQIPDVQLLAHDETPAAWSGPY